MSSTRRRRRVARCSATTRASGRPVSSRRPSATATLCATSAGSESAASSTIQAPSGKLSRRFRATWIESRVFPHPPEPRSVTSRADPRSRATSSISPCRPTKLVSERGRLLGTRPAASGSEARPARAPEPSTRERNPAAISEARAGRRSRSLAMARSTIASRVRGRPRRIRPGAGGSVSAISWRSAKAVGPSKGSRPVTAS